MKTFILVTPSYDSSITKYTLSDFYTKAILNSGGIPILAPYEDIDHIDDLLDMVSGVVFSGGGDVHSKYFGEELHEKASHINVLRDEFEIKLCKRAIERNIPILAICRGVQVLNVSLGGSIIQHIEGHFDPEDNDLSHTVDIVKGSYFEKLYKKQSFIVNSIHHQALDKVSDDVEILAYSEGIIEAIKLKNKDFVVGLQYHPERIYEKYEESKILFDAFVQSCKKDK